MSSGNELSGKIIFAIVGSLAVAVVLGTYFTSRKKKPAANRKPNASRVPVKPQKTASLAAPSAAVQASTLQKGRLLEGVSIGEIRLYELESLRGKFKSADIANDARQQSISAGGEKIKYNKIIDEDFIINDIVRKAGSTKGTDAFVRAGPRPFIHFDPDHVVAAVVTCGGLCPGLNNVIREIVHSLHHLYGVKKVIGVRGGYNGFTDPNYKPMTLTVENTADIHHEGGTILASSRGGFDINKIINFLLKHKINQLYVIGGDGTHRGAYSISQECIARGLNISVIGIPKTIDNDVDLIDRSFGFQTSVEAAQSAIVSAHTEARCNMPNGIGIVKLMGRSSGFIAAHAVLASGDVDLCLLPEIAIELEGPNGCLPYLFKRVEEQGFAVVVVAEGAGEELLGESSEVDAGGNRKLPAIGEFIKKKIATHFSDHGREATVKYIDPSYMIRSVPANASDALYCMLLAQNAVHGAMAGYTAFTVGLVNNRVVFIPIPRIVATSPRMLDPEGRTWERVLAMTRQPSPSPKFDAKEFSVQDRTVV